MITANHQRSGFINNVSSLPAQSVYLLGIPNPRPKGVFDIDQAVNHEEAIEMSRESSFIKLSAKGKGKGKAMDEHDDTDQVQLEGLSDINTSEELSMQLFHSLTMPEYSAKTKAHCGICFDEFRITENPYLAAISATSSADRNKGLRLPCKHQYCLGCASQYLKTELEKGPGSEWMIPCPEVSLTVVTRDSHCDSKPDPVCSQCASTDPHRTRFSEEIAIRILGEDNMEAWVSWFLILADSTNGCLDSLIATYHISSITAISKKE